MSEIAAQLWLDVLPVALLSLRVSITAVMLACVAAFPLGALLALSRFPGKETLIAAINTLMGLPPVVIGLCVYIMLSNAGPLGALRLLYTPSAMILAQTILVLPIALALSREAFSVLDGEYRDLFTSLSLPVGRQATVLLWDARYRLPTIALACFGRAIAEVGAVIMVGGNIKDLTRVMTGAIMLETSQGELELAIALGAILLVIALAVNALVQFLKGRAAQYAG